MKTVKKTPSNEDKNLELNEKRVQLYKTIHEYHENGYSARKISQILKCSRATVCKYLNGDFTALCSKICRSKISVYFDYIKTQLEAGMSYAAIYRALLQEGFKYSKNALHYYITTHISHIKSKNGEEIPDIDVKKYIHISRRKIFDFLWMDDKLSAKSREYILKNHGFVKYFV